jgi:hypothetical protein
MTIEMQNQLLVQELQSELGKCREGAALLIHALNCAIQLTDALITYMPDNSPLHPDVANCKGALDNAMRVINSRLRAPVAEPAP